MTVNLKITAPIAMSMTMATMMITVATTLKMNSRQALTLCSCYFLSFLLVLFGCPIDAFVLL